MVGVIKILKNFSGLRLIGFIDRRKQQKTFVFIGNILNIVEFGLCAIQYIGRNIIQIF